MKRQQRRSYSADPPRAEAVDQQLPVPQRARDPDRTSGEREHECLCQEQRADVRNREAGSPEDADLPQPLLDPEAKEQHGEQQRRYDNEETEIREVLAEVGRAVRRGERVATRVGNRQPHRLRRERCPEILADERRNRSLGPGIRRVAKTD